MKRKKEQKVDKNAKQEELWKFIDMALIIMIFVVTVLIEVVKAFFRECIGNRFAK